MSRSALYPCRFFQECRRLVEPIDTAIATKEAPWPVMLGLADRAAFPRPTLHVAVTHLCSPLARGFPLSTSGTAPDLGRPIDGSNCCEPRHSALMQYCVLQESQLRNTQKASTTKTLSLYLPCSNERPDFPTQ